MLEQSATKAADSLLDKGTLGLLCLLLLLALIILGLVVRHLYNENKALHAQALGDREKLIRVMEASNDAAEGTEAALREMTATLNTRHQTVADLAQRVEVIALEARHGLRNLAQAIQGIAHLIDRRRPPAGPPEHDDAWGPR